MLNASQYLELYDSAKAQLGERVEERLRFLEQHDLDAAFTTTDYGVNVMRIPFAVDIAKSFGCNVPAVSAAPAVVVNDIFSVPPKLAERLPEGVKFMSLRRAVTEFPELIPNNIEGIDDGEARLNDLLWSDGAFLYVAPGTILSKPLQLVNIFSSPVDLMAIRRITVHIGQGSEAHLLLCDHTQDSENKYLSAELIRINIEQDAKFGLDLLEESSAKTTRRATINATIGQNGTFECTNATLSCGDTRTRINVNLNNQGACARVNGMVIADKEQRATYLTRVLHKAENTFSNQLFKYVADGNSQCEFNGKIVVDEKARFTEAYQTNRNLIASETAKMHTEPALEIYCDEVKCSHGATTGQLDPNALFYMRQRGIPEMQARKMLMEAFVGDVIDSVHIPGLRDRLHHLVERRFSGLGSDVASCADCDLQKQTTPNNA